MESSWIWKFAAAVTGVYFALDFFTYTSVAVYVTYISVIGACVFGVWRLFQPGNGAYDPAQFQLEPVSVSAAEPVHE